MRCLEPPRRRHPVPAGDTTAWGGDASQEWGATPTPPSLTRVLHGPTVADHRRGAAVPRLPRRLGRYRLIAPRARGGQAEVWEALQVEPIVERVAIKLLPTGRGGDPRPLARLRREARRGAALDHPALLPVFEFGVAHGHAYLVLPWVDGLTLAELLDQRRQGRERRPARDAHRLALLPEPQYLAAVARVLAPIARALHAAHAARVVHRDVKPQNILLDHHDAGRAFLIDFGVGRDLDAATRPQLRAREGTLGYLAPERLGRRPVDEVRCDVYALGVTLFEAVTLRSPWSVPEELPPSARLAYLARAEPLRPHAVRPGLPADLEAIVVRAMARDPGRRNPSAAALAADLERFLAGAPVAAEEA